MAQFFGLPTKKVPFFIGYKNWSYRLLKYYRLKGYHARWVKYSPKLLHNPHKLYLVVGKSWRYKRSGHAVLYTGRKKFFDPAPSGRFLNGRPTHILMVRKMKNENN